MPPQSATSDDVMTCRHCGTTEEADGTVVVGELHDVNDHVCGDCRASELASRTALTELEAEVAALEQLGDLEAEEIARHLDVEVGTVRDCERRIEARLENAPERAAKLREEAELLERTASELPGLYRSAVDGS